MKTRAISVAVVSGVAGLSWLLVSQDAEPHTRSPSWQAKVPHDLPVPNPGIVPYHTPPLLVAKGRRKPRHRRIIQRPVRGRRARRGRVAPTRQVRGRQVRARRGRTPTRYAPAATAARAPQAGKGRGAAPPAYRPAAAAAGQPGAGKGKGAVAAPQTVEEEDDADEFGPWRANAELKNLVASFKLKTKQWIRPFPAENSTLAQARKVAAMPATELAKASSDNLARVLYVLEREAPSAAGTFKGKIRQAKPPLRRGTRTIDRMRTVLDQARFYHQLYDVPCRSRLKRRGVEWPPSYVCGDRAVARTGEPIPQIRLFKDLQVLPIRPAQSVATLPPPRGSAALAAKRKAGVAARDRFVIPHERLAAMPRQFCVGRRCFSTYRQVAAVLFPGRTRHSMAIFCAPRKQGKAWSTSKVYCSSNWFDTLGGYRPWTKDYVPSAVVKDGALPPFACFGSPHLTSAHMVIPAGAQAGNSGFYCRKRVFRILLKKPEKDMRDKNFNIAMMCAEMRMQVWGEKYPTINQQYQQWCRKHPEWVKKGICLPRDTPLPGPGVKLPYVTLSREELMFFYGHQKLYCRADRPGLTHFLYNKEWAPTFTCGVPRGILESGPFEEGVQVCALAPFAGEDTRGGSITKDQLKARLHCWRFNRPTCEALSKDPKKEDMYRSSVFDVFDALQEYRRTHNKVTWSLFDLKEAEQLADHSAQLAFADSAADEGNFGVREFCRFDGSLKKIKCGYSKESMAHWYQMRKDEPAEGCHTGICKRGAFKRGYYCALYQSPEFFEGKLHWVCGIDTGLAGRRLISAAKAVCVGGARALKFQSPRGDRSALQCYGRRFRWVDSELAEDILRNLNWTAIIKKFADVGPKPDPFLVPAVHKKVVGSVAAQWEKKLEDMWSRDAPALINWARGYGHALAHRTSLRIGLMSSNIPAIGEFKALDFAPKPGAGGVPPAAPKKRKKKRKKKKKKKKKKGGFDNERLKRLTEIVDEVRKGDMPADGRWYGDYRLEMADGGKLPPSQFNNLAVGLRTHHVFDVMRSARQIVLDYAEEFASAIIAEARDESAMTRIGLMERARQSSVPAEYKSNVFCVSDPTLLGGDGAQEYICSTSPLLVLGQVERLAVRPALGVIDAKLRRRIVIAGKKKTVKRLSKMEADRRKKLADARFKRIEKWERERERQRSRVRMTWCYGGLRGKPLYGYAPMEPFRNIKLSSPYFLDIPAPVKKKGVSNIDWLKCSSFSYSDEPWERVNPGLFRVAGKKRGGKAGKIFGKIMKFLSSVSRSQLGALPAIGETVKKLANAPYAFYEKYAAQFVEKGQAVWEPLQKEIEEARDQVKQAEEKVAKLELTLARSGGGTKQAQQVLQKAKDEKRDKQRALRDVLRKVRNAGKIPGTGVILSEMINELAERLTKAVSQLIQPKARELLQKGFSMVRKIVQPIINAVVKALGSIPFVGGALAGLASELAGMALDKLEELAFDAIVGVVERVLGKLARAVIAPVIKSTQSLLLQIAKKMCVEKYPDACPRSRPLRFAALPEHQRWLARAFGCNSYQVFPNSIYNDAALARRQMYGLAAEMRREVASYVRDIGNRYLARYGLNLDSWLAIVGNNPRQDVLARAASIEADLQQLRTEVAQARAQH